MQRQFFSGNSIEQAVLAAARHYKIEPERLAYTVRDKKHGFVNIRKRVVIVVDPEQPEIDPSQVEEAAAETSSGERLAVHETLASRPKKQSPDRESRSSRDSGRDRGADSSSRDRDDRRDAGRRDAGRREHGGRGRGDHSRNETSTKVFGWNGRDLEADGEHPEIAAFEEAIERVLDIMDLEIEYTLEEGDDGFDIDFSGSDAKYLVEDDGRVLKAMENILPRVVRSVVDETVPCQVDCEGFQAKRRERLEEMARSTAERVIETGRYEMLDAMNPADRRLVHLALVDHPDVDTISEGRGYMKRVKIRPNDD